MVIVAQLGARMNYAVPRILSQANLLAGLYTDLYATPGMTRLLRLWPGPSRPVLIRRLLGRRADGVPARAITSFRWFGVQYTVRLRLDRNVSEHTATQLWAGRRFCNLIGNGRLDRATAVYTYNGAGLELLRRAKRRGLLAIVEQTIAPRRVEEELLARELERFPAWGKATRDDPRVAAFRRREEEEWETADLIVCGSEFVRDALRKCGGPFRKCVVVPYGVDDIFSTPDRSPHPGPLRVLTVGAVAMRKGSPYVLEVAKATAGAACFRMIGPWLFPREVQPELENAVQLFPPVPRNELRQHYSWADVFLLPSVCEGSATVTYEALSAGLPIICTPNTGSLVQDGIDGYLVPVGDSAAIVRILEQLSANRELLARLQRNAASRLPELSLEAYGRRLLEVLGKRLPDLATGALTMRPELTRE